MYENKWFLTYNKLHFYFSNIWSRESCEIDFFKTRKLVFSICPNVKIIPSNSFSVFFFFNKFALFCDEKLLLLFYNKT